MAEDTNVDVAELLAVIGEQTVIARKREQKISELQNKVKELETILAFNSTKLTTENG